MPITSVPIFLSSARYSSRTTRDGEDYLTLPGETGEWFPGERRYDGHQGSDADCPAGAVLAPGDAVSWHSDGALQRQNVGSGAEAEDKLTCPMCLDERKEGQRFVHGSECEHKLCEQCMARCEEMNQRCPLCRACLRPEFAAVPLLGDGMGAQYSDLIALIDIALIPRNASGQRSW